MNACENTIARYGVVKGRLGHGFEISMSKKNIYKVISDDAVRYIEEGSPPETEPEPSIVVSMNKTKSK